MTTNPTADRRRQRQIAAECSALVDLLNDLYPLTDLPKLTATDREIGSWLGKRELVDYLNTLRKETTAGPDGLPKVLGG